MGQFQVRGLASIWIEDSGSRTRADRGLTAIEDLRLIENRGQYGRTNSPIAAGNHPPRAWQVNEIAVLGPFASSSVRT